MTEQTVFHLGVTKSDLDGATMAIIPGDPRVWRKLPT